MSEKNIDNSGNGPTVPSTSPIKIEDNDRLVLEKANTQKQLSQAAAEKAIAQFEKLELQYKYIVLQLYMKYSLTAEDSIDENGFIIKGGAKLQ